MVYKMIPVKSTTCQSTSNCNCFQFCLVFSALTLRCVAGGEGVCPLSAPGALGSVQTANYLLMRIYLRFPSRADHYYPIFITPQTGARSHQHQRCHHQHPNRQYADSLYQAPHQIRSGCHLLLIYAAANKLNNLNELVCAVQQRPVCPSKTLLPATSCRCLLPDCLLVSWRAVNILHFTF